MTGTEAATAPAATTRDTTPAGAFLASRWEQFYRWGAYVLLTVSTLISAAVAEVFAMTRGELYAAGVLVLAAFGLQLWWGRARHRPDRTLSAPVYYTARTTLAFVLTWLNPLFAVFAATGYFDVSHLLPRRAVKAGLLITALTLAGSQSGGLPPQGPLGWVLFGGLFVINSSLALLFAHLGSKEAEVAEEKAATIAELERANARLELALAENAGLHAQLLVQAREAGVADERRRLAAEIHDTIAQGLTGIIAQLQVVTGTRDPDLVRAHVARATALARHSLGEARRSVQNLSPAELDADALPEALRKTVVAWAERTGVRAGFTVTGTEEPLHDEVASTLLRIAQEALANTARHARAGRVGVTLSYMGDEVCLDVRDDGLGFDPAALAPRSGTGGFGLDGMRARAERVAGAVTVESGEGEGTAVSARVPLVRHG
ncbi:sensor histidine kinase [Streptomyces liangshanensis]|uniref:Sensor histidine kinase n=1 Tax=Streptomyces liangshanensis TaxID=2717324 RepID=A0A6G9GXE9_9ACTN|nr:sensor histidine kinase [Streptomyces liangshanensis]QIQ02577.1 sensor histidine kinase [Streptomyces liangshanensis]